MKKTTNK